MLTKLPAVTVTPAVPYVAPQPERVICPPVAPDRTPVATRSGSYVRVCHTPSFSFINDDGVLVTVTTGVPICTKVWVDSGV